MIKGPVAIAGSIPLLFKNKGIKVPIIPATITTATKATERASAIFVSPFHDRPEYKINIGDGQFVLELNQLEEISHQ